MEEFWRVCEGQEGSNQLQRCDLRLPLLEWRQGFEIYCHRRRENWLQFRLWGGVVGFENVPPDPSKVSFQL